MLWYHSYYICTGKCYVHFRVNVQPVPFKGAMSPLACAVIACKEHSTTPQSWTITNLLVNTLKQKSTILAIYMLLMLFRLNQYRMGKRLQTSESPFSLDKSAKDT